MLLATKEDADRVPQDDVHSSVVETVTRKRKTEAPEIAAKRVRLFSEHAASDLEDDGYGSSSDEKTTSDEDHGKWSPGDGVCPSTSHFNMVYQSAYNTWCSAASKTARCDTINPLLSETFLNMVQDVPDFFSNPPEELDLGGGSKSPLTLRSSLHLVTTEDGLCEQSWRSIDYLQCLGFPEPMTYKCEDERSSSSPFPFEPAPDRSGYLASITLAWSYIISCRWVEALQRAGQKSFLRHNRGEQITTNFWDLVLQSRWDARVETKRGIFYSPWMLRKENLVIQKRYVHFSKIL